MPSASSSRQPIPVQVTSACQTIRLEADSWRALGETPLVELQLPDSPLRAGWMLLQGRLLRKNGSWAAYLHAETDDDLYTFDVPVSRKGTINELFQLPPGVRRLLLEPMQGEGEFELTDLTMRPVGEVERVRRMYQRVIGVWYQKSRTRRKQAGLHSRTVVFRLRDAYHIAGRLRTYTPSMRYGQWVAAFDTLKEEDFEAIRKDIARMRWLPRFRVMLTEPPADSAGLDVKALRAASLKSLQAQLYPNFEIAAPASPLRGDAGTWFLLLPVGTRLAPHALYWLARTILGNRRLRMVYSDHDHLDAEGVRCDPVFKPDWTLELLRSTNYIGHAVVLRGDLLAEMQSGEPAEPDMHGLLLRAAELLPRYAVGHVHAPLVHVPLPLREAGWGRSNPVQVFNHLSRLGVAATVEPTGCGHCRVRYALPADPPLVSILIPTRDCLPVLRTCVESVLEKTRYRHFEICIVDNQSEEAVTLKYLANVARRPNVRVLHWRKPFNFSAINNHAARHSAGQALCLMNNDTEVISPDWLEEMLSRLQQPGVGVVGAKLYYTDDHIQHAGDAVGPGGCADHLHSRLHRDDPGYCHRAVLAQEFSAVTAACMLTWKRVFERLQGFDAVNLPVAFNDVDYCLRVRDIGLQVHWTPYAELYHHESYSRGADTVSPERKEQAKREVEYMRNRWKTVLKHDPFYNPNLNYARPDFTLSVAPMVKKPWK